MFRINKRSLHDQLASAEALPTLSLLGMFTGLLAGLVILAFRQMMEGMQEWIVPGTEGEGYEQLSITLRIVLPVAGGLLIGGILQWARAIPLGVPHVMERLAYHQAHLPLRNFLIQFVTAVLSIVSGHSVGREGPAVHLGATSGSLLGQKFRLPDNATRTLVACGIAAAIGASFNTPLAGVIFAMEVVMMEYAIASFAPIILAAVSATALTRIVYGDSPAFIVPPLELGSVAELPYMVLVGIVVGGGAALFIRSIRHFSETLTDYPIWQRTTLAGILVALVALPFPQVMGIGYDTVNSALIGEMGIGLLLAISLAKIIATTGVLGLGIPGGLIGPTLVVGATLGAAMGAIGGGLIPELASSPTLYALIGMGAMMGATLHAPLAALIAMLELSANPNILLPGMLAVISAGLVSSELFGQQPIFITLLKVRGLDYRNDPITQHLRRIGVTAAMERAFIVTTPTINCQSARTILEEEPTWIIYQDKEQPLSLIKAVDLASYIQRLNEELQSDEAKMDETDIVLDEIPAASRIRPLTVSSRATLQDALEQLNRLEDHTVYALCVADRNFNGCERLSGVLTRRDIESYYQI